MVGQMLAWLPMLSVYAALAKPEPLGKPRAWRIPGALLRHVLCCVKQAPRATFWNVMAGICTGTGWFLFQLGTPVVSRAVGLICGGSAPLMSIFIGAFIFREFRGQGLQAKLYS